MADRNAVVIGAGIIGLTTAACLLDAGWQVRVVALELREHTTSAIAPAIWYPPGEAGQPDRVLAWAEYTYYTYLGQTSEASGVALRSGRELFRSEQPEPPWAAMVGGVVHTPQYCLPAEYRDAHEFTVPMVEMPVYLAWLTRRVVNAGGRFEERRVSSLDDVEGQAELIVNCAGLGAAALASDDDSVLPVRGQIVRTTNPGLDRFVRDSGHPEGRAYVYPRRSDCILGGTDERDRWDLEPDPHVTKRILRVCRELEPSLSGAEVIQVQVGLRPWRPEVRLEMGNDRRNEQIVVHNYGHGGAGVTLAWGCARNVMALVSAAS